MALLTSVHYQPFKVFIPNKWRTLVTRELGIYFERLPAGRLAAQNTFGGTKAFEQDQHLGLLMVRHTVIVAHIRGKGVWHFRPGSVPE
jgi:hypothetical protein